MRIDKGIIYETSGADPETDRIIRHSSSGTLTIVAVAEPSQILDAATRLADQGARLIELCGGISVVDRARVHDAVGDRAQVSSVMFGIESIVRAAAYNEAFTEGRPRREAFIILEDGADPAVDRLVWSLPLVHRTFVFAPDEKSAPAVAAELVEAGVGLIELYGGFSTRGAAAVVAAVDGKAPVGVGSFAYGVTAGPVPRQPIISRP